jgi:hypothetical protein
VPEGGIELALLVARENGIDAKSSSARVSRIRARGDGGRRFIEDVIVDNGDFMGVYLLQLRESISSLMNYIIGKTSS